MGRARDPQRRHALTIASTGASSFALPTDRPRLPTHRGSRHPLGAWVVPQTPAWSALPHPRPRRGQRFHELLALADPPKRCGDRPRSTPCEVPKRTRLDGGTWSHPCPKLLLGMLRGSGRTVRGGRGRMFSAPTGSDLRQESFSPRLESQQIAHPGGGQNFTATSPSTPCHHYFSDSDAPTPKVGCCSRVGLSPRSALEKRCIQRQHHCRSQTSCVASYFTTER